MPTLIVILALATIPTGLVTEERVDFIEVNHFYDEQGRKVFDQQIFWEFDRETGRSRVRAWRMLKEIGQYPERDWRTGDYVVAWSDCGDWRRVRATWFHETWTQHDPELEDRERWPKCRRPDLRKPLHWRPQETTP